MSQIATVLGKRIRNYRNRLGLTQEQLAEKSGLHSTYIGQLERGEKNVTIESLEKIVRALGITFECLFEHILPGNIKYSVASECYDIIQQQPLAEQKAILELIKKTIAYKNL